MSAPFLLKDVATDVGAYNNILCAFVHVIKVSVIKLKEIKYSKFLFLFSPREDEKPLVCVSLQLFFGEKMQRIGIT